MKFKTSQFFISRIFHFIFLDQCWLWNSSWAISSPKIWCCESAVFRKFGKLSSGHRTGKGQLSFQFQKDNDEECSNYRTIALISHASKLMLKILWARLQQYVNRELADVQAGFRKGRGTRDQIAKCQSLWWCGSQQTGKFLKRWEYQTTFPDGKDWCWSWNSNTLATWCEELTHLKRPRCWERLRAGGEGENRGWDGWMASPTRCTWVWIDSGSWWWTGRPGVLRFMGSQRVGHNWATELNWSRIKKSWNKSMYLMVN